MLISMTKRHVMLEVLKIDLIETRAIHLVGSNGLEEYIAARQIKGIPDIKDGDVLGMLDRITKLAVESNGGAISLFV
jgi:hypothetical protein